MRQVTCVECGVVFTTHLSVHMYCSVACRRSAHRRKYGLPTRPVELTSGTTGALSELMVSCDLMAAGYDVFRAMSPSAPYDVIACRGDEFWRVEIRSCVITLNGDATISTNPRDKGRADLFATVTRDGRIGYYPDVLDGVAGDIELSKASKERIDAVLRDSKARKGEKRGQVPVTGQNERTGDLSAAEVSE